MPIKLKNKVTLEIEGFKFKCCIGKNGLKKNKLKKVLQNSIYKTYRYS